MSATFSRRAVEAIGRAMLKPGGKPTVTIIKICEGHRHVAPGMYLGVDARWYVRNQVQSKCPTCGQALPV